MITECHQPAGAGKAPFRQALWIRRGEQEPVKVMELSPPTQLPYCRALADDRAGGVSIYAGLFQRVAVSPDGTVVVFEITDDHSPIRNPPLLPKEQEGFYVVRADGSGLRWLARQSRTSFVIDPACYITPTDCKGGNGVADLGFSPDGRLATLVDQGPDDNGKPSPQVFTLNVVSGERKQLTTLSPLPQCDAQDDGSECRSVNQVPFFFPRFIDANTIAFWRPSQADPLGVPFTVRTDDREPEPHEVPRVATGSGALVPVFGITGDPIGFTNNVPGTPINPPPGPLNNNSITEAFVTDGTNIVQITNFHRSGTVGTRVTLDRQRVMFRSSANPPELGTNPSNDCQYFSANVLGGDLRQLTFFGGNGPGCNCDISPLDCPRPSCTITGAIGNDSVTGSEVFASTCDPFGTNPTQVAQFFALRSDSSGLRQLTFARGVVEEADGSLTVELAGPLNVATRRR